MPPKYKKRCFRDDSGSSDQNTTSESDSETDAKTRNTIEISSQSESDSIGNDSGNKKTKTLTHKKSTPQKNPVKSDISDSDDEPSRSNTHIDKDRNRSRPSEERRYHRHHQHKSHNKSEDDYEKSSDNIRHKFHKYKNDEQDDRRYKDKKEYSNDREIKRRYQDVDRNEHRHDYNRKSTYSQKESHRIEGSNKHKWNYRNEHRDRRSSSFDHSNAKWGKSDGQNPNKEVKTKAEQKQKPNFGLSGKLTEETNTYRGVVIKYSEPPEARKPKRRWRLYPFKGEKALQTLYIHRESGYLIGRDRKVVDIPVDHPSCSKQHAALQYRLVSFAKDDGSAGKRVRPYIIDLDSANGTYINNKRIDPRKYVELLEKDVIKFGYSSREYVLLHENSKDEAQDDDVKDDVIDNMEVKQES